MSMGKSCHEVAKSTRVDKDTVMLKKYAAAGLQGLLAENHRCHQCRLEPYTEPLKKRFEQHPPHTVIQAVTGFFTATGIRLQPSACRDFLKCGACCDGGIFRHGVGFCPQPADANATMCWGRHQTITATNETYLNQQVFCTFLTKIAAA